jgi:hypothetical protein
MFQVKEFHPDVCKDPQNADLIMRRVTEAYQVTKCMPVMYKYLGMLNCS